jgi:hypothetical protein
MTVATRSTPFSRRVPSSYCRRAIFLAQVSTVLIVLVSVVQMTRIDSFPLTTRPTSPLNYFHPQCPLHTIELRPPLILAARPEYVLVDGEGQVENEQEYLSKSSSDKLENYDSSDHGILRPPVGDFKKVSDTESVTENRFRTKRGDVSDTSLAQYVALAPGQHDSMVTLQVQVGDIGLARKAWKKRRRSDSPLLVPVSILSIGSIDGNSFGIQSKSVEAPENEETGLDAGIAAVVRANCVYLLQKFGTSTGSRPSGRNRNDVKLNVPDLVQRYRSHLRGDLSWYASRLGFDSVTSLLLTLFSESNSDGKVRMVQKLAESTAGVDAQQQWTLQAAMSRSGAIRRADEAAILQVIPSSDPLATKSTPESLPIDATLPNGASTSSPSSTNLLHSGLIRTRRRQRPDDPESHADEDSQQGRSQAQRPQLYELLPLSAALRVTQEDLECGRIFSGSVHSNAVTFSYDRHGDAGEPLLTLSLDRQHRYNRPAQPTENYAQRKMKKQNLTGDILRRFTALAAESGSSFTAPTQYDFSELSFGSGPLMGQVVALFRDAALVDCGVRRREGALLSSKDSDNPFSWQPVLGILYFKDCAREPANAPPTFAFDRIEDDDLDGEPFAKSLTSILNEIDLNVEDEEEIEDITHLFTTNDKGDLVYTDPETGESEIIDLGDMSSAAGDGVGVATAPTESVLHLSEGIQSRADEYTAQKPTPNLVRLRVGDRVEVFVKSVSKQSSQLLLTLDDAIQETSAQAKKYSNLRRKKSDRLAKQLGGWDRLDTLLGLEFEGTVQASSQTGDWLYVRPLAYDLPVGVAAGEGVRETLCQGDTVRIQLLGVDESRCQLSFRIIERISIWFA